MFSILWSMSLYAAFALGRWARRAPSRGKYALYGALILLSMAGQLLCLSSSGLLSPQTALPLHLCSFSGVLALPALLGNGRGAARFLNRLGRLGAALALLFPAPLQTRVPALSDGLFYLTHALLIFLPLKKERGGALGGALLALLLVSLACAADAALNANYLFLRRFPAGAPHFGLAAWPLLSRAALFAGLMLIVLIPDGPIFKGGKTYK